MAEPDREALTPEPEASIRVELGAAFEELAPASSKIRGFLRDHGVDDDAIFAIETVIEEIASNAIKYAFRSCDPGTITLEATATPTRAELTMEDDGEAFDPTEVPDPEMKRSLADMPIGGLGIHLVRELTNEFHYKRINDKNQIRVWVKRQR